jgi:DNA invertase Pin-like site-specific DNA recombinase
MKRAVLYLRVSTIDQTTANQERELREIADRMGCEITKVYKDHGISGAKGRDKRPAFDALCRDATKRQFDVVMAWSVDRLGRSLQDLVGFLSELHALRIDLYLHQQGLDTRTPAGKAMFQMMGVFAEFERPRHSALREQMPRQELLQHGTHVSVHHKLGSDQQGHRHEEAYVNFQVRQEGDGRAPSE